MITTARMYGLTCCAAAAAWPFFVGRLSALMMSPLERALRDAWCGAPMHDALNLLGHCVACWAGSALLGSLGLFLLVSNPAPGTAKADCVERVDVLIGARKNHLAP